MGGMLILVAEDDPLMRAGLEALFVQELGHQMIWASTAKGAIDLLFTEPVDLAILDYQLDGIMTGLEVAKFVKRLNIKDGRRRKVIILSAHPLEELQHRAQEDAVNALEGVEYFQKPLIGQVGRLIQAVNAAEHR
jgi:CheY-like chemotaxis protein